MNLTREFAPPSERMNARHALLVLSLLLAARPGHAGKGPLRLDVRQFRPVSESSGRDDYYRVVTDEEGVYLRSEYRPPYASMVRGYQIDEPARRAYGRLRWRWRAQVLPSGGNECIRGHGDSAAAVLVTWKSGLKLYVLKYVWSTEAEKGAVCHKHDGFLRNQRSIILESGGPVGAWVQEEIVLDEEFRRHFGDGNPRAKVPDFVGVGVMTDGDQTNSPSAADYAALELVPR